jgi:hypothetical protein
MDRSLDEASAPGLPGVIAAGSGPSRIVASGSDGLSSGGATAAARLDVAQIAKDLGARANARKLARAAAHYEGAAVRRLGYLLEHAGHTKPAQALHIYANSARHFAPLDPGLKPVVAALAEEPERDASWKLLLNEAIEVDA